MYHLISQLFFLLNRRNLYTYRELFTIRGRFSTASFQVRAYAVSVLERADDEELQCYLLQLVQALRFERSAKSRLSHFLIQCGMCMRVEELFQVLILVIFGSFLKET